MLVQSRLYNKNSLTLMGRRRGGGGGRGSGGKNVNVTCNEANFFQQQANQCGEIEIDETKKRASRAG